jgi:hypothetical protein
VQINKLSSHHPGPLAILPLFCLLIHFYPESIWVIACWDSPRAPCS